MPIPKPCESGPEKDSSGASRNPQVTVGMPHAFIRCMAPLEQPTPSRAEQPPFSLPQVNIAQVGTAGGTVANATEGQAGVPA
jgi:hypothetical protein